jgi:hypothetical protein
MDSFGNDEIARLLRLKRYEQPPPAYFENFLHEFRRRQRDELLRQSPWRICFERAQGFALRHNVRPYPAGILAVAACAAVISITIYQQPDTTQFAVQSSPVPTRSPNTGKELDFAPPVLNPTFNGDPTFLPSSRDIPLLPADLFRSDEFVPFKLEWGSTRRSVTAREIKLRGSEGSATLLACPMQPSAVRSRPAWRPSAALPRARLRSACSRPLR